METKPKITIRQLVMPASKAMWTAAFTSFIAGITNVIPYIALTEITRLLLAGETGRAVWGWAAVALVTLLVSQTAYGAGLGITHFAEARLRQQLRERLVHKLGRISLGSLDQTASGKIRKIVVDDTASIHTLVAHLAGDLVFALVSLGAGVGYLLWVNWQLTGILLAIWVLIIGTTMGLAMSGYGPALEEFSAAQTALAGASVELVQGIKEIKNFQGAQLGRTRFEKARQDFTDLSFAWAVKSGKFTAISMALLNPGSVFVTVVLLLTWFSGAGWIEPAYALPFIIIAPGLPMGLQSLFSLAQHLYEAKQAALDTAELLSIPDLDDQRVKEQPVGEHLAGEQPEQPAIEFKAVTFGYDLDNPVINNLNLKIPTGKVTALVGPSGGGKSTLARLIARFYDVNSGTVEVFGKDVRAYTQTQLLKHISIVFQDVVLAHDTVAANIALGIANPDPQKIEAAAKAAYIHDRIMRLSNGYQTVLDEDAGFLSGGERQRLTIARAFYQDAPILILDEATAQADPHAEAQIHAALSSLAKGRTVVIIAHRLHTIAEAAQIAVLTGGELTELGTHQQLLDNQQTYARLWENQMLAQKEA